jgi:hypothetical protein
MSADDDPQKDERATAVEAWVASFDHELEQSGNFAAAVAAMAAHGCFDVRAVVERWILANPTAAAPVMRPRLVPEEPRRLLPLLEEEFAPEEVPEPEQTVVRLQPVATGAPLEASPDIAHFHSLLQGGIDRAQIYEAFPAFRHVIDAAVVQYEAAAPILSEAARGPSREELDDEVRSVRQELEASAKRPRRRWRSRD